MLFPPAAACRWLFVLGGLVLQGKLPAFAPQYPGRAAVEQQTGLRLAAADALAFGTLPVGWADAGYERPARNWGGDARGALRFIEKHRTGLLATEQELRHGTPEQPEAVAAEFSKTDDAAVTVGVALRMGADGALLAAELTGGHELRLTRRGAGGSRELLASLVALRPYRAPERWQLWLVACGAEVSAVLCDADGAPLAQVDARATTPTQGAAGVIASEFVAIHRMASSALAQAHMAPDPHAAAAYGAPLPLVPDPRAAQRVRRMPEQLARAYDVVIAGAGTGGTCAAVQAARLGCRVLLVEETDWIGGQMSSAGVTSIDEGHVDRNFQDRERGLYRQFHEAMQLYYYGLGKTPQQAYYSNSSPRRQENGGYEPRVTQDALYALLADAPRHAGGAVDVLLAHRVAAVQRRGGRVAGVALAPTLGGAPLAPVRCKVLIDATEYGDVLPLAGVAYRAGNSLSTALNLDATPQDNTWMCVLREYPGGVPPELRITTKPPRYDEYVQGFKNYVRPGLYELTSGQRMWRGYLAWRGMADSAGPLLGRASENRHTRCGINGGNDYPVSVRGLEDPAQRLNEEREGLYRTLAGLYYFQNEVGANWSVATDEGYATDFQRANLRRFGLNDEHYRLALYFAQRPYVRESRRVLGLRTLRAGDLGRFERWRNQPHAVAIGDYYMDLHRTEEYVEHELDAPDYDRRGGPFQVPVEAFIPAGLDGLLVAEKNLSQSRIASGATRLQPVTMLTGQAAGVLAALSVRHGRPARALDVLEVQQALLAAGSTLAPRWHADVPHGSAAWRAVQLLSLHEIWDVPGPLSPHPVRLGRAAAWGWARPLESAEAAQVAERLGAVLGRRVTPRHLGAAACRTRGEYALRCAEYLLAHARIRPEAE